MAEPPATDEEQLEYMVRLGMFVFSRWEAIADDNPDAPPTNDDSSPRWDECTERDFDKIGDRARRLIEEEVSLQRVRAVAAFLCRKPWDKIIGGLSWVAMTVWEHFVGAVGLVIFGLVLLSAKPYIVKEVRSAVDEFLPAETRPADLTAQTQVNERAAEEAGLARAKAACDKAPAEKKPSDESCKKVRAAALAGEPR